MSTGLGYGSGLVKRQTVRNNQGSAGADIPAGGVVQLVTSGVGSSGVGDDVLLGEIGDAAPGVAVLGIAEREMKKGQGTAAGEGEWGHVVEHGLVKFKPGADVIPDDALAVKSDGTLMKATVAQINAGEGVGVCLETVTLASGDLANGFVNFLNRDNAGSSGYGGAET